jgi:dihydroorotate dehydrogenase electron transfer subunit
MILKGGRSNLQTAGDYDCTVLSSRQVLPGVFSVEFESPEISSVALPGQFVQVEPSPGVFPVTRRPVTINRLTESGFELLFDVIGRGTQLMARFLPGDMVRVMGPLGKGWDVDQDKNWLLIGGGLGAAGFQFLVDSVRSSVVIIGASGADRVISVQAQTVHIVTEDGSRGSRGLVTALISEELLARADSIAVCGPVAMMEAVWNTIPEAHRSKVQVSTESRMGCGWGVCDGCSIPVSGGGYRKCCVEGPVFPGDTIDWKRWNEAGL